MTETKPDASVLVAGSANVDFVVRAPHIPAPGETVIGGDLAIVPGGKGANQAVACARAGAVRTTMLLSLGNDVFAPLLERSLTDAGVSLERVHSERPTGAALICVADNAENAITVAPGANASLAPADLPDLAGLQGLVLQLETPIATVTAYAAAARAAGVRVFLNAAPAQSLPSALLRSVDVLVVNEEELFAVSGGKAGQATIAQSLARLDVQCIVVTLGARGAVAFADGCYYVQPAFPTTAIDTTGAGDTFCGVLAAALSRGASLPDGLRTACAAAALSTSRLGAQSSIPESGEVERLLAASKPHPGAASGLADYCGLPPNAFIFEESR